MQIDSLLIFSIVKFGYTELRTSWTDGQLAALMGVSLLLLVCVANVIDRIWKNKVQNDRTLFLFFTALKTLISFIGAQAVVNTITIHTVHERDQQFSQNFLSFVQSTIILVILGILPNSVTDIQWCQRCISIILFMYTDAIDKFLSSFNGRELCLLVFTAMYTFLMSWKPTSSQTLHVKSYLQEWSLVLRALKLFTINTSTQILLEQSESSKEQITIALLVVIFTSLLSILCPYYQEAHGYAMWAVSQILSQKFELLIPNTTLVVIINLLLIIVLSYLKLTGFVKSFTQLTLLVTLNTFLNIVNSIFFIFNGFEKLFILFIGTVCMHEIIDG